MEFEHLGKKFILVELVEPFTGHKKIYYDILQIMEIVPDAEMGIGGYEFVSYFYGASMFTKEEAIETAKAIINRK